MVRRTPDAIAAAVVAGLRRTRPRRPQPPPSSYVFGPYVGMRDSPDPTAGKRELARNLRNVYPVAPHQQGRLMQRPGYEISDFTSATQDNSNGAAQLFIQFTKLDGTELSVMVSGGEIFVYDWVVRTWNRYVTAAQMGSFAQNAPAARGGGGWNRVYGVVFADQLILSDGVNRMIAWDGTEGAGGITQLTNAPICFGQPVVHYGKLAAIDATDRATFMWSEENQPNTGYDQGGYNNVWTLRQTDTRGLVRLLPTNEQLYVFRLRSITSIYGEVNQNFSSTGTREAVSSDEGTVSPASVFFGGDGGNDIFFVNADGRPHWMRPGLPPVHIWEDAQQTIEKETNPDFYHRVEGYWDPLTEHAVFVYYGKGEAFRETLMLRYHTKFGKPQLAAVWDGYDISRIGVLTGPGGRSAVFHGQYDVNAPTPSNEPYNIFRHGAPGGPIRGDRSQVTEIDGELTGDNSFQTFGGNSGTNAWSIAFQVAAASVVCEVEVKMEQSAGGVTEGSVVAKIYSLTGTYATNALPDELLATSEPINVEDFPALGSGETTIFRFKGTEQVSLAAGVDYVLTVEPVTTDDDIDGAGVAWRVDSAGSAHTGNMGTRPTAGAAWEQPASDGQVVMFSVRGCSGQVKHRVETHQALFSESIEWVFDQLDLQVRSDRDIEGLQVQHVTPYGTSAAVEFDLVVGRSLYDVSLYDVAEWDNADLHHHTAVGIHATGMSIGIILEQEVHEGSFSLETMSVRGRPMPADALAR